jgi:hypothetical protein
MGYVAAVGGGELPFPPGVVSQEFVRLEPELEASFDRREPQDESRRKFPESLVVASLEQVEALAGQQTEVEGGPAIGEHDARQPELSSIIE